MNKFTKWMGLVLSFLLTTAIFFLTSCGRTSTTSSTTSSTNTISSTSTISNTSTTSSPGPVSSTTTTSSPGPVSSTITTSSPGPVSSTTTTSSTGPVSSTSVIYYTISFETNGGSEIPSQQVQGGFFATRPEDPTKTNFVFSGWFKDENLESIYDFDTEIVTSDITIYASWSSPGDTSIANFYWNYVGAPEEIYFSKVFKNNTRIEDPGTPEREGFYFAGWFIEDGTAYNKLTRYTGNQQFYAKWKQIYIFEAEKTQLTGLMDDIELGLATDTGAKRGYNYSGEANGVNLIKSHSDASGGKYISGLYYRGGYLQFEINSDKAVADATLRLVLSCEYADISLTYKTYKIMVNRTELKYDNNINLGTGAGVSTEPGPRGGFTEIIIGNINLNQGNNVIRLTVNNNQTPAGDPGTVDAASPIVDCIIIYADAALTMTEYPNS